MTLNQWADVCSGGVEITSDYSEQLERLSEAKNKNILKHCLTRVVSFTEVKQRFIYKKITSFLRQGKRNYRSGSGH